MCVYIHKYVLVEVFTDGTIYKAALSGFSRRGILNVRVWYTYGIPRGESLNKSY